MRKVIVSLLAVTLLAGAVSGCGKKGRPFYDEAPKKNETVKKID